LNDFGVRLAGVPERNEGIPTTVALEPGLEVTDGGLQGGNPILHRLPGVQRAAWASAGTVPQSGSGIGSRWLIEGHTKKTAQTVRDVNGYNENSTKILLLLAIIFCNSELTG
jgi:hypothetical protein